jgi:alkylated DNA repair protein (DNA oxidative demethylase)
VANLPEPQAQLFAPAPLPREELIATCVTLLRGFAAPTAALVAAIEAIAAQAPFRCLQTPGGGTMSVAMSNCGAWGWHSDRRGYRYVAQDPLSAQAWPAMPAAFLGLAQAAALRGGFPGFEPDCCLVNRYVVGAQMGAHRDFDELDMRHPIVSVSIGLPARFSWHGATRREPARKLALHDGDVLVWGGEARAGYHAVSRLAAPVGDAPGVPRDPELGPLRYNLTFRRAR